MKIILWLVLGAVCVVLLVSLSQVAAQTYAFGPVSAESRREPLKGLSGVGVFFEDLGKEVEYKGLTKEALRTCVELQLRKAGIKVLSQSEWSTAPGMPLLVVNVSVYLNGPIAAFNISLRHGCTT